MACDIKVIVSIPNTMAWINPTKNSSSRNADWANTGTRLPITKSSTEWVKVDQSTIKFPIKIPKDGEKVITYTIRYTW